MPTQPLPIADLDFILEHCRAEFTNFHNTHLLITGGSGFFGRWLIEALLHANQQLHLNLTLYTFTRNLERFYALAPHLKSSTSLQVISADIRQLPSLNFKPTHIIHAATDTTAGSSPTEQRHLFESIVLGTQAMLDFAMSSGTSHFLLTSSGGVYGKQPSEISHLAEDYSGAPDPLAPGSAYGIGKRAAEYLCGLASRSSNMHVTIARGYAFVGPLLPLDAHFAIGNFIRDALMGNDIIIKGDGTPVRSYLYAADLVIWLVKMLLNGTTGHAYNLGSDQSINMRELAQLVVNLINPSAKVIVQGQTTNIGVSSIYVPSIQKARQDLQLKVYTDLPTAIQKTAAWNKS
jgi:dTDP-glucose 4,6-dehydratase